MNRHPRRSRRRAPSVAMVALVLVTAAACDDGEVRFRGAPGETAPPAGSPPAESEGEAAVERALFERTNDERRERGLEPLEWDDQLATLAEEWSREMGDIGIQHREFDQELLEDRLSGFVAVGENVFSSSRFVPAGHAHVGWMQSEGHRANLLSPNWDRLGVGVVCTADGEMYATQNFGRTAQAGLPPEPDPEPPPREPIARPERDGPTC